MPFKAIRVPQTVPCVPFMAACMLFMAVCVPFMVVFVPFMVTRVLCAWWQLQEWVEAQQAWPGEAGGSRGGEKEVLPSLLTPPPKSRSCFLNAL